MNKYKYQIILIVLFIFIIIIFIISSNKKYLLRDVDGYLQKIKFDMIFISHDFYIGYSKHKTLPSEEKYYKSVFKDLSDPFSGKPYIYKINKKDEFIIYSVGPDCQDDGGMILKYNQNLGNIPHLEYLSKNDKRLKGDIVMRIKIPFRIENFNKEWNKNYHTLYDSYFFDYTEVEEKAQALFELLKDTFTPQVNQPQNEKPDKNKMDGEDNSSVENKK